MNVSIIVPVYNEEKTIGRVLSALFEALPDVYEVIAVDDGSTDSTVEVVYSFSDVESRLRLIQPHKNQGKTAALRAGFATSSGDIVLVQDADLEYDPRDIPDLLEPIVSGNADVVYGSRFLVRRAARVLYFRHYLANWTLAI